MITQSKFISYSVFCILILISGVSASALQINNIDEQELIAVLEFEGKNISQVEASILTDLIRSQIVEMGDFKVLERDRMESLTGEWKLQMSGLVNTEHAVKVGNMLGVSKLVLGSIGKVGRTFSISANFVDIETGELLASSSRNVAGNKDDLLKIIRVVAYDLFGFTELSDLIEHKNNEYRDYNVLGDSYRDSEMNYAALFAYKEAEKLKPSDTGALFGIGYSYLMLERFEDAILPYQRIIATDENNSGVHSNLGLAYENLGRNDNAIKHFKLSLEADEKQINSLWGLSRIYGDLQRYNDAIRYSKKAIKVNSKEIWGYYYLGQIYFDQNRINDAIKQYEKAIEVNPDHAVPYIGIGWCYFSLGRYEELASKVDQSIRLDPDLYYNYIVLGYTHYMQGDFDKAIRMYSKGIQKLKNSKRQRALRFGILSKISFINRNYKECIELGNQALQIYSKRRWFTGDIAFCQLALGKFEEAKISFTGAGFSPWGKWVLKEELKFLISRGIISREAKDILRDIFK